MLLVREEKIMEELLKVKIETLNKCLGVKMSAMSVKTYPC